MMITTSKMPKAIIFFGPDGSGKTTQADLLVKDLEKNGVRTKRLWLRSLHTLAFVISKLAMRILDLKDVYEFRSKYSRRRSFRSIWYIIEFISIIPLVLLKFRIPLSIGYTVVAERYIIDWMVSVSYASRNELFIDSLIARLAFKLIPKQSLLIFIDASYDAIRLRGRTEDSFEFIQFQRTLYARIANKLNSLVINTSDKTLPEVHELISQYALQVSP